MVEVRFDHGAVASIDELRSAGAKIIDASARYQVVTVAIKPGALEQLSGVPRVEGASEVLAPITAATCPSGDVVSEGDQQLKANLARETPEELDGSGIEVGVLSDSFDRDEVSAETNEDEDVKSADLPGSGNECGHTTPVDLIDDTEANGEDEGRAMAQIVHDLAPGASLSFASAFTGVPGFAENIESLRDEGADVIVDDVAYPNEPFFQEGPVSVAIGDVTESGATYFSAAGNNNLFDAEGNEISSWETPEYRDSGGCPPTVKALPGFQGNHCLDFHPGSKVDRTFGVKVSPGATLSVDLQWAEPWEGVETDLDVFLLNATGALVAASADDNVAESSQKPFEFFQWENESGSQRTVQVVINRFSGNAPRLKFAFLQNGSGVTGVEYPKTSESDTVGPVVFGHNGAADAISVAAVPFDDSASIEVFSSRGPVTRYFGPTVGPGAAAPLTLPETLTKPDLAATDCGVTTFFSFPVFEEAGVAWRFCGTSAAAPHAAAVAALMAEAKAATPAEIRTAFFASSNPVGAFGPCAAGAGIVDAVDAVQALLSAESASAPSCPPPAPEVSNQEAQASGNWGAETPPQPTDPGSGTPTPAPTEAEPTPALPKRASAPTTSLKRRPPRLIRTKRATARAIFVFGSNDPQATFRCRVDKGRFRPCPVRFVRRFKPGSHVLRVKARNADGETDRTPATFRFRVMRVESR